MAVRLFKSLSTGLYYRLASEHVLRCFATDKLQDEYSETTKPDKKYFTKFPAIDKIDAKKWRLIYLNDQKFIYVQRCGIFNGCNAAFFGLVAITLDVPMISDLLAAINTLPLREKLIISVAPVMYTHLLIKTINFRRRTMIRLYQNFSDPNKYALIWYNCLMQPQKIFLDKKDFRWKNHTEFKIEKTFAGFRYLQRIDNEFQCYLNEADFHFLRK